MSTWTYVRGCCLVEVYGNTDAKIEQYLNHVLKSLPKVTGSEGPVTFYYSNVTEYSHRIFNYIDSDNSYEYCKELHPMYYVTVFGNLRDRLINVTKKEVEDTLRVLSTYLYVSGFMDVHVYDDMGEYIHYNNNRQYKDNYDCKAVKQLFNSIR